MTSDMPKFDPKKAERDFTALDDIIPYTSGKLIDYLNKAVGLGLIDEKEKDNINKRFHSES